MAPRWAPILAKTAVGCGVTLGCPAVRDSQPSFPTSPTRGRSQDDPGRSMGKSTRSGVEVPDLSSDMENGFVVQKTLASGSQSAILAHWWNGQCNARRTRLSNGTGNYGTSGAMHVSLGDGRCNARRTRLSNGTGNDGTSGAMHVSLGDGRCNARRTRFSNGTGNDGTSGAGMSTVMRSTQ